MRTDELDFHLPPELIAQEPPAVRHGSRLLHYRRADRAVAHRHYADLPSLLRAGDLLVFNDTQVIPARFLLRKPTGGLIEGLFLSEIRVGRWNVLLRNLGNYGSKPLVFDADPAIGASADASQSAGAYELEVATADPASVLLSRLGRMPLPPYIKREKSRDARDASDRERYQTVFAQTPGSVAAPTAALHFSPELLEQLETRGVERTFVTLDVGMGTFKPVTADTLDAHTMHIERYTIGAIAADAINRAKREGRRVIAVGTTAARVLESQPAGAIEPRSDSTQILIYPPYAWKHVQAMLTNFHLPRSTLIALVAALVGIDEQRRLYAIAIAERYRFFSYGDGMLIE